MPRSTGRSEALAKWNHLYTKYVHDHENRWTCFYCGDPADTLDHQPPITRVLDYRCENLVRERYIKVFACGECNNLASDTLTLTILDRDRLVSERLAAQYAKLLKSDEWQDEDFAESGVTGRLKESIRNHYRKVRRVLDRLDYSGGVQAYLDEFDDQ